MRHYKYLIIAFISVIVIGTPWLINMYPKGVEMIDSMYRYIGNNYTAVFLQEAITIKQLHKKYSTADKKGKSKVRILIVPGHEPDFGGTQYDDVLERDIVVDLAKYMKGFFEEDGRYEVVVSRDEKSWNPVLLDYFSKNWDQISSFVKQHKEQMFRLVNDGSILKVRDSVIPNDAPINIAMRLYGMNKWANENNVDIAIHVHFNDYPRRNKGMPGEHSGFSIYVPEKQYSNSTTTRAIANSVFNRLAKYNPVSDLEGEAQGITEHQELIAIGAYNTLNAPSMLIEYGYIYEQQIVDPEARDSTLQDLAFQTYLGVQDFFGEKDTALVYDTLMLPHDFNEIILRNSKNTKGVLALQTILISEGLYPPESRSKNDCPRTGLFGPCTVSALGAFQNKYGIKGEVGMVGEETKKVLNSLYSAQLK